MLLSFIQANYSSLLLAIIAIAIGWLLGRYARRYRPRQKPIHFSQHYFTGLNYLLNEQPDKAVDTFVRLLDIDSDTVETHLAIGNLFRRRGEVERAIRIHQGLIARPNLSKNLRIQGLIELGRDYMYAGVYDRAERLFLEAIDSGANLSKEALNNLLTIYQQEKDWQKAIEYGNLLQQKTGENVNCALANYYCELAMEAVGQEKLSLIKKAANIDKNSVRASLLEGDYHSQQGDYKLAIRSYKRVKKQDPDFIAEVITRMVFCYEQLQDNNALNDYLYQCLNDSPCLPVILTITDKLQHWQGDKVAIDFIVEQMRKYPSMKGLSHLIDYLTQTVADNEKKDLQMLQSILQPSLRSKPDYQCQHCGFTSSQLHWLCPGCKHWNTNKPMEKIHRDDE